MTIPNILFKNSTSLMSTSLFKRLSRLGLSPHAWKTFLYLNFIAPKWVG